MKNETSSNNTDITNRKRIKPNSFYHKNHNDVGVHKRHYSFKKEKNNDKFKYHSENKKKEYVKNAINKAPKRVKFGGKVVVNVESFKKYNLIEGDDEELRRRDGLKKKTRKVLKRDDKRPKAPKLENPNDDLCCIIF